MSLSTQDQEKLKKLEKTIDFKHYLLKNRDPKREQEKMSRMGTRYVDHLVEEIATLEWARDFIKNS